MKFKYSFFGLTIAMALFSVKAVPAQAACVNPIPVSGFATPCPVLSVNPTSTTASGSVTVTAAPGAQQYISKAFYIWNGSSWLSQTFVGTFKNNYATTTVTATLGPSLLGSLPSGTIYVASWDWTHSTSANCFYGPSSTTCGSGYWRLQSFQLQGSGGGGGGAPTSYPARTDNCELGTESGCAANGGTGQPLSFHEQVGGAVPNVGGFSGETLGLGRAVNVQYVDPDFHSINIRATDGVDSPAGVTGPSGGDVAWWAVDSRMFIVSNPGQHHMLRYFNPATRTVTASQIATGQTLDATHFSSYVLFSSIYPNVMFELKGTVINRLVINTSTDSIASRTQIVDLQNAGPNCLASGYVPEWHGNFGIATNDQTFTIGFAGGPDWGAGVSIPSSPAYFVMPLTGNPGNYAFEALNSGTTGVSEPVWPQTQGATVTDGGVTWVNVGHDLAQDTGFDIASYTIGKGCRHYNTLTGYITGDWGCSYAVGSTSCTGPANASSSYDDDQLCGPNTTCLLPDSFHIHGADQINDPRYVQVSKSNCVGSCVNNGSSYYWDIGTNMVRPCYAGCDGHQAKGTLYVYRGSAVLHSVLYGKPDVGGHLNPGVGVFPNIACDYHGSYNNADANDDQPFFLSTVMVPTPRTGTPAPWCNEVMSGTTNGSMLGYRFGSSYNSGSESSFQTQNGIGVVSPDGLWYMRMTDMMGTLGNTSGGKTCNQLRGDSLWSASTTFSAGARIMILANNNIYQVTTAGTSGANTPTWCNTTGCTVNDGSVVWTDLGTNDCRADWFITDLMSAH